MLTFLYDVRPTSSSQTSSNIEVTFDTQTNNVGFFNISAPVIESRADDWKAIAEQVLSQNAELWEKLARL